ncbi:MAG: M23 family metallopeptidase, partial [Flammeovirgaceae bacterium]
VEGTPIYAYFPGKIINVGVWDGSFSGYGNWVIWQDDIYGVYHFFGHMRDRPGWSPGQKFSQGTLIGHVGNTGRSFGPHLHWEISESRPSPNGNFNSIEDPGSWLRKHPLISSPTSQRTPAQIS